MIDEKTLNDYFALRKRHGVYIRTLENQLRHAEENRQSHDQNLHSAAAEYILHILTDPNNPERYMAHEEIEKRLYELDARFEDEDIDQGLDELLRAEPPKIEGKTLLQRKAGKMAVISTAYRLKEDTR